MEQKMTKIFCHRGQPVTANYTMQLPPNVRACIFWLRNRRPEQWRENRPLLEEEDDRDWVSELEAASERARLAAIAEHPRAGAAQSAAEGPVPTEVEAERAVRSAAERLHVHS
jgi:hypothetical protein